MGGARREMSGIIYLFSEFWSCCADVDSLAQNRPWPHRWHVPSDECWGKGRARGAINKIVWGGGEYHGGGGKKVKISSHHVLGDTRYFTQAAPRAKIGRCSRTG